MPARIHSRTIILFHMAGALHRGWSGNLGYAGRTLHITNTLGFSTARWFGREHGTRVAHKHNSPFARTALPGCRSQPEHRLGSRLLRPLASQRPTNFIPNNTILPRNISYQTREIILTIQRKLSYEAGEISLNN